MSSRALAGLGCLGIAAAVGLLWAMSNTPSPSVGVAAAAMVGVGALLVGPWLVLASRRMRREPVPDRLFRRVVLLVACLLAGGIGVAAFLGAEDSLIAGLVLGSVVVAALVGMVAGVLVPWIVLLIRTVNRERAARALAEERASVAAHLHDTVLQSLTLIQKRAADPQVVRLARTAERDLRSWLDGERPEGDDYAATVRSVVADIEERHAIVVELICVGTGPLDDRARAFVGALREAVTNAAVHSGARRVSVFTEATDGELIAIVRDRGRGFDLGAVPGDRRGIADSISGRMRRAGGTARIHTAVAAGTEVELHLPGPGGQSTMDDAAPPATGRR